MTTAVNSLQNAHKSPAAFFNKIAAGAVAAGLPLAAIACIPASWPRWLYMWLAVAAVYFGLKLLTLSVAPVGRVLPRRILAYLFAWPGLNATRFLGANLVHSPAHPSLREWLEGAFNAVAGATIFWGAHRWTPMPESVVLGWAGMIGVILMLHFGTFHLLSCAWRSIGVDARPLMNYPMRSTSLVDFWGRRWNTAFRDVTHQFLFRPLTAKWGGTAALVIVFVFSGLLHELVISVPAAAGYGGPTAFFVVQAAAILFERSAAGRAIGLGRGWSGWLFTAIVLLLPVRLLFHDPFVVRVVLPFMEAMGAA